METRRVMLAFLGLTTEPPRHHTRSGFNYTSVYNVHACHVTQGMDVALLF